MTQSRPGRPRPQLRAQREQRLLQKIHLSRRHRHWQQEPLGVGTRRSRPTASARVREFHARSRGAGDLARGLRDRHGRHGVDGGLLDPPLRARGIEVLRNARHRARPQKRHPGLPVDPELHTFGLLRGSFRPDAPIAALRSLIRHRDQLVASAAAHIQRMQKALVLMNLQLHHVITDVTGVTGLAILRDIVAGETDPAVLARHRDPRCKATRQEIAASLTGHYRAEQLFVLRQAVECYDFYQAQIGHCDDEIQTQIGALEATRSAPAEPLGQPGHTRRRSANEPASRSAIRCIRCVRAST